MKKTLKAGASVKIQGIPVELTTDVDAESSNWEQIENIQKEVENADGATGASVKTKMTLRQWERHLESKIFGTGKAPVSSSARVRRHVKELHIYHKIVLRNLELQEEINKIAAVLQAHMTALKLEGLRGNQVALQAFIDVDEMWRELFDCSIEDDERGKTPNSSD
jgi:hypothetical protein